MRRVAAQPQGNPNRIRVAAQRGGRFRKVEATDEQAVIDDEQHEFVQGQQEHGVTPEIKLVDEVNSRVLAHDLAVKRPIAGSGGGVEHTHHDAVDIAAVPLKGLQRPVQLQRTVFAENQNLNVRHACARIEKGPGFPHLNYRSHSTPTQIGAGEYRFSGLAVTLTWRGICLPRNSWARSARGDVPIPAASCA